MSPQELEKMPKEFEKIMQQLEERVMADIVRRIKINSEITRSGDWQIYRLEQLGKSKEEIKEYIQQALNLSDKQIDKLYEKAFEEEYVRNKEIYELKGIDFIPFNENAELQQLIGAMMIQTKDAMHNIAQSTGFIKIKNGKRIFTPLTQYYQDTLDNAIMDITTGTFDYNTVLKRTVNELTNSGLRTVDFASGRSYRVDSAVRTAVMTGISQVTGHISEKNAKDLGTEYFEVTAHGTARPSHQVWQGKVFTMQQLKDICGYGSVTGLKGANCYHDFYPFFPGISERTYTDKELDEWAKRENTPKEYNGKEYTTYEASQKQRKMELLMRKQREDIKLLQEGEADKDDIINAKSKYRATMNEYVEFSDKMGLSQQIDRINGSGLKEINKNAKLNTANKNDILLSDDEQYAVNKYISSDFYTINEKLRNNIELSTTDRKICNDLDMVLAKMPNYNGDVQRSLILNDEQLEIFLEKHQIGMKVNYPAYTSTTKGERYNFDSNVELYVIDSKLGKDISQFNKDEQEVLYKRDSKFIVKEIEKINNTYHILLEEV